MWLRSQLRLEECGALHDFALKTLIWRTQIEFNIFQTFIVHYPNYSGHSDSPAGFIGLFHELPIPCFAFANLVALCMSWIQRSEMHHFALKSLSKDINWFYSEPMADSQHPWFCNCPLDLSFKAISKIKSKSNMCTTQPHKVVHSM